MSRFPTSDTITIECDFIEKIESKGSIELGNRDTTFIVQLKGVQNLEEIFIHLLECGYGTKEE